MSIRKLGRAAAWAASCAAAASASAGEIRGRVLVDGKPDPTVVVRVLPFEDAFAEARREARREELPKPLGETPARPDGGFTLGVAAPLGAVVRLAFSGPKVAPRVLEALLDAAGDDAGETRLAKAVTLAGRVVDERGSPVVGATVTLFAGGERALVFLDAGPAARGTPQLATTKPDGSFRFETASAEGNRLRVEAPAFATLERQPVRGGALARPLALALGQVLRGSVTFADKKTPARGALVRFEGRTQTTRWVEARADGGFAIDGAPREPGALVADGAERGRGSMVVAPSGPNEPVLIALAPTATLGGRVVDADSAKPLAGVRLVARADGSVFLARSGSDGRYSMRGLGPRRYRLSAEDDRFVPWTRNVSVEAGQAETQDVPLARAATLTGRVVDTEGAPIEGARIQVTRNGENVFRAFMRQMEGESAVRSGKDGSFRATRLMPGDNQRLDVRHDEYEPRAIGGISLTAGATKSGLAVVMRRGLALRGLVKDEEGRPLAGAEVNLTGTRSIRGGRGGVQMQMIGPGDQVRRETGADGRFEFRGLKAGEYAVAARRPGFARAVVDPVKIAEGRAQEPLELVLKPGATIAGVLHDKLGQGASGWFVAARSGNQGGAGPFGPAGNRSEEPTGPDGAFLLEGLIAGESYELQVMGSSGLGPRKAGVTAPADGVDLTVNGTGQIRGRVVDGDTGRPLPDFQVRYQPDAQGGIRMFFGGAGRAQGPYQRLPFHAEDGAFVLEDVPAGRWSVEAFAQGYQTGSAAAITVGEGESSDTVEVRLTKGGVLSGRVLEARTGRPILDASVLVAPAGGGRMGAMLRMGGEGGDNETRTDADGRYEIAGLAPGNWVVTASHPDWSETTTNVEVKDGPASADIKLGRGGSVGGSVVSGARPVAGAQVTLAAAGDTGMRPGAGFYGGGEQSALTDEGGRFRFDRLTPGRYQLSAALRDQTSASGEAVLTGDESQEVQLVLSAGAVVKGVVSGLPEPQLTGINVGAQGQDYFAQTRTTAGGAFELSGVPTGALTLRASAGDPMSGMRSAQSSVTLAAGQAEATAEIVFEPGFRVDGHVTRGGRPVTDAFVGAFAESGGKRSGQGRTDESGAYVIDGLDEATYTFTASSPGGAPIRRTVPIGGDATVDLEAPPARLAGTVVEADSGRPLADVSVRIEEEGADARFMSMNQTDSSGRFSFEDLEPKAYRLSLQKPAYQVETRQLQAAEESDLRIELKRGEGVSLEAKDGIFATPLRGLFVRVSDGGGASVFAGSVSLDSDGRGEVPSLKPGVYELRAESSGYAPVRLPSVTVPSRTLSLLLTPGGSLEIQAGPTTLALLQPTGRLIGADQRVYMWSAFSTDGKVRLNGPLRRLENVAPGAYTFEVEGGVRRDVTITEGSRAVVSLP